MLVALPVGLILLAGAMYLWQVKLAVEESLPAVIRDYARRQAELEVSVGRVRLSLRSAELWNLQVRTLTGDTLLETRYLRVQYPSGEAPLRLTAERPQAWLQRDRQGRWNIEPLLRRPPPEEPTRLHLLFNATDGTLHFEDLYPETPVRETIQIRTLRMIQPLQSALIRAEGASPRLGAFHLEALTDGRRWLVNLNAPQMEAAWLQAYLPSKDLTARQIRAALALQLGYEPEKPLWLVGFAEGVAQSITFRQKPVLFPEARFTLNFTESLLAGSIRAEGATQLALGGKADWSRTPIAIAGQLQLAGSDAQSLWRLFSDEPPPVAGAYRVEARFGNTLESPLVSAQVHLAEARTPRGKLRQIRFPLFLKGKEVWLPQVEALYEGRPVHARLYANLAGKQPEFRLYAVVEDFPANLITELKQYPLTAKARVEMVGWGTLEAPHLEANLTSDRVMYNGTPLGTLRARLRYENRQIDIPLGVLQGALGTLQLTGTVALTGEKPRLDLALNAHAVDLNRIAQMLGYSEGALVQDEEGKPLRLDGIGYATLQVRGTPDAPEAIAEFAVFDGRLGDIGAEITAGTLTFTDNTLLISELRILRRSAQMVASGSIELPEKPDQAPYFVFSANATDLDLKLLTDWTRLEMPLAGVASAKLTAEGTPQRFMVEGEFNAQKAQVDRVIVQQAQARMRYEQAPAGRRLQLEEGRAQIGEGTLQAQGSWQSDGTIQAEWQLENLPLREVAAYLPPEYLLQGALSARGQIQGTLENPEAQVELWSSPLELNRVAVGTLEGTLLWHSSQNLWADLRWSLPEGEIALRGLRYNPETQQIVGTGEARDVPVQWLHRLAQALPVELPAEALTRTENFSGVLNLALNLGGTLDAPALALDAQLGALHWNEQSLGTLTLKGEWQGAVDETLRTREVRLERVRWLAENTRLEGSALWTPDNLQADLEISQFPLHWARLWDPALPEIKGTVDLSLLASGAPESPALTLSATVQNLEYEGYQVDQILFSQVDVVEGRIETGDALIRVKDYQARLSGTIPFRWSPLEIPREEPLAVEVRLTDQPLRLLELFAPIDAERTEGILNARLRLEGTLENLQPRGTLSVENGAVGLEAFQTALQAIGLQVEFDGSQARILQASAQSSQGGSISLSGTVDFTAEKPTLALNGTLDNFTLREPKLPFGGSAEGTVRGEFSLSGEANAPLLQARLQAPRGVLNLPAEFTPSETGAPLPLNPKLDVRVAVAEDFTLRNPNLDARMEGELNLTGTLEALEMNGVFRMPGGVLNLPTARLRIEPDSLVTVRYPYTLPTGETIARINLDVRANTSVVAPDLTGDPIRYRVEVDVRGPLDDPERLQLTARSDPPWLSEQRILTLLGRGTALSALARGEDPSKVFREQLSDILTAQVLPTLFSPLEAQIAEAFDLEQFAVDYSGLRPASVYLVKNLFDGVGIAYRRSLMLSQQPMYEVRLFYRLPFRNRLLQRMRIGVGFDQAQTRFLFIEGTVLFK